MLYPADMHIHSNYSFDGRMPIEYIIKLAIKKNLKHIALTEHMDLQTKPYYDHKIIEPSYFEYMNVLKQKYKSQIEVLFGVEFAEPHFYKDELKLINSLPFDYVLGSIHFIDGKSVSSKKSSELATSEYVNKYYDELLKAVRHGGFDCVAHFDNIRRCTESYDVSSEKIDQILNCMIENNIALEVNTSGIRRLKSQPFPTLDKLQRYIKLGGKRLTVGSDTHREHELYDNVELIANKLNSLNVELGIFRNRQFVKI